MDFSLEAFSSKQFCIKTESDEQLERIKVYYPHNESASTVTQRNRESYPYIFYESGGIHGAVRGLIETEVKFSDWLRIIEESESDYDYEESEYDISFLME